jgi:hypothetical protein
VGKRCLERRRVDAGVPVERSGCRRRSEEVGRDRVEVHEARAELRAGLADSKAEGLCADDLTIGWRSWEGLGFRLSGAELNRPGAY